MELHEILAQFREIEDEQPFPWEAVTQAVREREAITPFLLQALDDAYDHAQEHYDQETDTGLSFYSMYLLAQFREQRAFPKLLRLMTLREELLDYIFGDILTEDLSSLLYSTYNGDLDAVKRIVEDDSLVSDCRACAAMLFPVLYREGKLSREALVAYLREQMSRAGTDDEPLANTLAEIAEALHLFELTEDVRDLFEQDKMDVMYSGDFANNLDYFYKYDQDFPPMPHIVEDAGQEMSSWPMFYSKEREELSLSELRERLKTGRNALCPCGSGKKYKKCCLHKDEERLMRYLYQPADHQDQESFTVEDEYPPVQSQDPQRPGLSAHYDETALYVDRPAYEGMTRVKWWNPFHTPSWQVEKAAIRSLWTAYTRFCQACEEEGLATLEEFDERHKVHYLVHQWLEALLCLMHGHADPREKAVRETVVRMGGAQLLEEDE